MSMLKDLSNAGMIKWDGFGRVLHRIASYCMAYCMAQQFTTPTMFSTIKIIQLFQLRKFYDNCLIVRLVLHCTALLKAPHIITITIFKHWISFYMKSQVLNSRQNAYCKEILQNTCICNFMFTGV